MAFLHIILLCFLFFLVYKNVRLMDNVCKRKILIFGRKGGFFVKKTDEEKLKKVEESDLFDDLFFSVAAEDIAFCEEVLQTILQDKLLKVESVIVQRDERNLYGRSAILDALCILGDGTRCNIEIQKEDNLDHIRRVRFNSSLITARESNTGDGFDEVITLYVVYISRTDILKRGKTIYHVVNTIRETGEEIDDGLHRIFVNAEIKDDTDISELMDCFTQKYVNNSKFPNVSKRVEFLKKDEGGRRNMLSLREEFIAEGREEAKQEVLGLREEFIAEGREEAKQEVLGLKEELKAEGREEGEQKAAIEAYKRCIQKGMSKADALEISNLTEDKVQNIL